MSAKNRVQSRETIEGSARKRVQEKSAMTRGP
jgi:hypothetical protein